MNWYQEEGHFTMSTLFFGLHKKNSNQTKHFIQECKCHKQQIKPTEFKTSQILKYN